MIEVGGPNVRPYLHLESNEALGRFCEALQSPDMALAGLAKLFTLNPKP